MRAALTQTAASPSRLLGGVPIELRVMIFNAAQPTTQRILASTCKEFYGFWKKSKHNTKSVKIHVNEIMTTGSIEYTRFMTSWILRHWREERELYPGLAEEKNLVIMKEHIQWLVLQSRLRHRSFRGVLGSIELVIPMVEMEEGLRHVLLPLHTIDRKWRPSFQVLGKSRSLLNLK